MISTAVFLLSALLPLQAQENSSAELRLENLIPLAAAAIEEDSYYEAKDLVDFQFAPIPMKECAAIVTARSTDQRYLKTFNVCILKDPETQELSARAFFDYACRAICAYPHPKVVEHYISAAGFHQTSPEEAFAKAARQCQGMTDGTGRLLRKAYHGGPDGHRTPGTVENSCIPEL